MTYFITYLCLVIDIYIVISNIFAIHVYFNLLITINQLNSGKLILISRFNISNQN